MENITSLKDIIQRGDLMGQLDLKDAYLSIPIAKAHWRYLRFQWKAQNYEFRTLPFGLASAPRVFTKLLRFPDYPSQDYRPVGESRESITH